MSGRQIAYATDEDVSLVAASDFVEICPRDQVLAAGTDGVFTVSDRWALRSATVDFAAAGIAPGHLVQLLGPIPPFGTPGDVLAVASVTSGTVVLRRKGLGAGLGHPPAPAAGLTGVEFLVATLTPQIGSVSEELDRRFGIDASVPGRRPEDLAASGELREVTILEVLHRRYTDRAGEPDGVFGAKAERSRVELERATHRLVTRWACGGGSLADRFRTRISR
jgi:hypothetical protein